MNFLKRLNTYFSYVNRHDIALFFSQLTVLYTAGISLHQCLKLIESYQSKTSLRIYFPKIREQLLLGVPLSQIFSAFPQCFNETTCQLLQLGQQTGKLHETLKHITKYHEHHLATQQDFKKALFYPACLFSLSMLILFFLLIFIVPKFAALYQNSVTSLPFITQLLFSAADMLNHHLMMMIIVLMGTSVMIMIGHRYHRLPNVTTFLTHFPIIKKYHQKALLAQFSRHLNMAFSAGLPIDQSITLAANAIPSLPLQKTLSILIKSIQTGHSIHQAMQSHVFFPLFYCDMVKTGEEAGQLELMLSQATYLLESDVAYFMHKLKQSVEPLIMTILGVVIGLVILSLYLPIFNLGNTL